MSENHGYEVLLIDLDGTVIDYARTEAAALAAVYRTFFRGHAEFPAFMAAFRECNDDLWAAYRQHEISLDVLRVERFVRVFARLGMPRRAGDTLAVMLRFEHELGRCAELFADSLASLRALRSAARLVLVTDGIAGVQHAKLATTRLRRFFEHVVISSEAGFRKPDPALFRHALASVSADRRAALMVGDSPASDGAGAAAAGIDFCWVNRRAPGTRDAPAAARARFQVPDLAALAARLTGGVAQR